MLRARHEPSGLREMERARSWQLRQMYPGLLGFGERRAGRVDAAAMRWADAISMFGPSSEEASRFDGVFFSGFWEI